MIQLILIIVKIGHNSRAQSQIPRCGRSAVAFLPQDFGVPAGFCANPQQTPNPRPRCCGPHATNATAGCDPCHEALARIELSPLS
jgi:hypothetical protein